MADRVLIERVPPPFELSLALSGHGWFDLPPHEWNGGQSPFRTVLRSGHGAIDVVLSSRPGGFEARIRSGRPLSRRGLDAVRRALRRMLRLDEDLSGFWALCRGDRRLDWVARRGGGRLLRSATAFEDLLKILLTTNTSWAGTKGMAGRLVEAVGAKAPSGRRAFPAPEDCPVSESFWKRVVRAGYRSRACVELVAAFRDGMLRDDALSDPSVAPEELRERLSALRGFGPYAIGQAMRLFGRYEDLALDSWCRAKLAERRRDGRPPSDRSIARSFRRFAPYQGLALWCDLTSSWHEDGSRPL
ncbi:MAG: hypothetical protein Fur0037_18750 [Planctomycetota bacterium]